MPRARLLIHYAELALKGRNRRAFETVLQGNLRHRLRAEGLPWPVHRGHDRLTVEVPEAASAPQRRAALDCVREVPGVSAVADALHLPQHEMRGGGSAPDPDRLCVVMTGLAAACWRPGASFAVRVNRGDKGFPLGSEALARRLGQHIIDHTRWQSVDLDRPGQAFHIDLYPDGAFLYADREPGPGGLPVGSGGRVLALLSGGIDSPVAAWMLGRRGCAVDFLHLTAGHVPPAVAGDHLVTRIALQLSRYTLRSRLWLVPYTHFDLALTGQAHGGFAVLLLRRFMARLGERAAARCGARALVSGDSLGQVASQTLENVVTNSHATGMPVLQPLIGLDKQEIVERARRIGTFGLSTQPYKDCCALIARHPRTRSTREHLEALERRLFPDYPGLLERSLADTVILDLDTGRVTGPEHPAADPAALARSAP